MLCDAEFKQRMFEEKNAHREEIEILENRIQDMRGRVILFCNFDREIIFDLDGRTRKQRR